MCSNPFFEFVNIGFGKDCERKDLGNDGSLSDDSELSTMPIIMAMATLTQGHLRFRARAV